MAAVTNTLGREFAVFLSFRSPDTRRDFTDCLYHEMREKNIRTFKDDEELRVGQKIEEILEVVKNCQIYIPIFSKGFASSHWCLREIAGMVDCTSESKGKKEILPVFLDVTADDVNLKTDVYKKDLYLHVKEHGLKEVERWEKALVEVPTRVGWILKDGQGYGELIKSIVREVQLKQKGKDRAVPVHLVETDDVEDIEELLDVDSPNDVLFVIISGTGGTGKSTLASVIFNHIQSEFRYCSFLEDVQSHDLLDMQKKLLFETLGSTSARDIHDTNDGIDRIRGGLSNKRVLLVIDNVDEKNQLKSLAGSHKWFGPGSRIIVTVRDQSKIQHEETRMQPDNYLFYPIKEMRLEQAIRLFNKHAFGSDTPSEDCSKFSEKVISSIGRLPLTLEVAGSLFAYRNRSEWEMILKDLIEVPHGDIRKTLMISVKKLDEREKHIFLNIACFCIGQDKTNAYYMWQDCGYSPYGAVRVLLLMSLIKIDENNRFWMHDEIRDLGRYIVRENNFQDAGERAWVWIDEKTSRILSSNKENSAVQALSLGIIHNFTREELVHFPKLMFLGGRGMNFVGEFKDSLPNLRWLSWHHCPLNPRARNLHPVKLVVLDLSHSNITHDWIGWNQIEKVETLKVLDLTHCKKLTKTPDFSEFGNLEILILAGCSELSTIDSSIQKLKLLRTLNIKGCISLQGLPEEIGSLECLSEIIMPSTRQPFKLPDTLGNLKSLTRLDARGHHGISQLPESIGGLTNLTHLILHNCKLLNSLPNSIGELKSLVELDLEQSRISEISDFIGNMEKLKVIRVGHTNIERISCAIGRVETLEEFHAQHCYYLNDEFLQGMCSLTRLRILNLHETRISKVPTLITGCSSLQTLIITSQNLRPLPVLPSNLKSLLVSPGKFPVLSDLRNLVLLDHLEVWRGDGSNSSSWMYEDKVISPWEDARFIDWLPRSLSILRLGWIPQLPNFSDFKSLSFLYIHGCPMQHFPDLKYLDSLRELEIWWCKVLERTPDLSCLKRLHKLQLIDLPKLVEIPGLGELESLKFLHITDCNAIKHLPNLSKLKFLRHLKLDYCEKIKAIEGLKEVNSLKKVEIKQCMSLERLPDVPTFTRLETDWSEAAEHTNQSTKSRKSLLWKLCRIMHDHKHSYCG